MSLSSEKEYASLAEAIAAIGSDVQTLQVANALTVTSNLTVPRNVTLSFALDGQISVAAGATLTISGPLCAPARQIFGGMGKVVFGSGLIPRVYPQWWGAWADGTHPTETTAAIRAAMGSVFTDAFQPPASYYLGSSQVVEFLAGRYAINDEIDAGGYANVITGSEAIIEQADNTKNILNFSNAYTVRVSGLRFVGGAIQLALSNPNVDSSLFQIDHCEFQLATTYAITATPTAPAHNLSALLTIDNCKFINPKAVLQNYCDYAGVNNSWVTVGQPPTPPNTAIFSNMSGELSFHKMIGVPSFVKSNGCRWIDNYGNVFIDDTRFGGEDAGLPIIYHYAAPQQAYPWLGSSVVIRNSAVFPGQPLDPTLGVLNLQTNLPQVFIYEGNMGPVDNPLIVNGGGIDLDKYLSSFSSNVFRYVAEPNSARTLPIPEQLQPLFNFLDNEKLVAVAPITGLWQPGQRLGNVTPSPFGPTGFALCQLPNNATQWVEYGKSSPFPIGPQQAQIILPGNTAKYSFDLLSSMSTFVATVTVSANPNFGGSTSYRTVATYVIGLTTGYDGTTVVDVLTSVPLFQPATPAGGAFNLTSLGGLFFGNGNTGSNQRPHVTGGSFTVLWTNVSRIDEAFVTIEIMHLS